jgi:hypothetical protein
MHKRATAAFVLVAACGHPQAPKALTTAQPPARRLSFLERTSPKGVVNDTPHVDAKVTRREGPASLDEGAATLRRIATGCYLDEIRYDIVPVERDMPRVTLTIDTRADGTMEEALVEPASTPRDVAMCLVHALAAQPLHLENAPRRLVLAVDAHVWWSISSRTSEPPN